MQQTVLCDAVFPPRSPTISNNDDEITNIKTIMNPISKHTHTFFLR